MKFRLHHVFLISILFVLAGCAKQTTTFGTDKPSDYYPLQTGKYATYILDSAVYVSFGQVREVHRHYIRDIVDATILDNLGRASFRIRRLMRNDRDTTRWDDHSTYMVTPLPLSVEVIEDNLRFIKLQGPITELFSWNGNRYLPDETYTQFGFNSTAHSRLGSWDYNYTEVDGTLTVNGKQYPNTITVACAIEDTTNFPPRDPNGPAFKTVWTEKYAKGVGLVYKEISLEEFQPKNSTYPNGYYSGFGLKQSLIDHN